jgi:CspA family cold shock protein
LQRGYGFITKADGTDLFCHHRVVTTRANYKGLDEGECVEFIVSQEATGLRANEVTGPNGEPCQGIPDPASGMGGGDFGGAAQQGPRVPGPAPTEPAQAGMVYGTCKWFDTLKGYGFITPTVAGRLCRCSCL